jgi:hypothetical protein
MAKVIGIDVAGDGPDSHCIAVRHGLGCSPLIKIDNLPERELAARVARIMDNERPDMVFIDHTGGYGTELLSRLRESGYRNVRGVNFGKAAIDKEHYPNIRSEMFHKLRDWIIDGGALPEDEDLEQELSVLSVEETTSGKAMLIKKDDIRELIGRSPDKADALALTFAEPVRPQPKAGQRRNNIQTVASTGYNPLEDNRNLGYGCI